MGASARFSLPFLAAGQAQKELVHNEALQALDLVVAAAVEEGPRVAPPSAPQVGETYIVDSGGTGAWLGRDSCLAGFTDAGWKFVAPREGTIAYVASMAVWTVFRGGAWEMGTLRGNSLLIGGEQVVGARSAAISAPTGGATVDAEARTAVGEILATMRAHGLIES